MKGCCPFHGEKTPSFYVYDDGYHCFGCGAHGDAISFLMHTSAVGFVEAVQSLAGQAGLDLPKPSPDAAAIERRLLDLHGVLDAAQRHFRDGLTTPGGAAALAYLRGRGLSEATIARFGLGWAGEGRGALAAALAGQGITQQQLAQAGLLRTGDDGEVRGELFFNRVMFPIRDRAGRMISFGGRTLGDAQPKYVNGPETALFSKRRTLYGLDFARASARRGAVVVVVEGYMDVIALHQAGFPAAMAPLGTALTAEQFSELWRLSPSPVLCFDGDAAGGRAAARAAQTALPSLAPDRTIRLASLSDGEDPDTLVRKHGAAAFAAVVDAARPLDEALFGLLRGVADHRTPEARAEFRRRLELAASSIQDRSLAAEYRRTLLDRFFAASRRNAAKPVLRQVRPMLDDAAAGVSRANKLTAILLRHPGLLRDVEEAYGSLPLPPELIPIRNAMLEHYSHADVLDSCSLLNHLDALGLAQDVARVLGELPSCGRSEAQPAEAEAGWWHFYGLMHRNDLDQAKKAAERHVIDNADDPAAWARLDALSAASFRLSQGKQTDSDQEAEAEAYYE